MADLRQYLADDPVLDMGPHGRSRYVTGTQHWLLWPAFVYRVVAPRVRARTLNVFQRGVLSAITAGISTPARVAELLCLEVELVEQVVADLRASGLLDRTGRMPTSDGRAALERDSLEVGETVSGLVFQDPWTGELWARFVEAAEYAEIEASDGTLYRRLLRGTRGTPRPVRTFTVIPRAMDVIVRPPTAREVIAASNGQHRAERLREQSRRNGNRERRQDQGGERQWVEPTRDLWDDGDASDERLEPGGEDDDRPGTHSAIARVAFVDEHPSRVFLATYLYEPIEADADGRDDVDERGDDGDKGGGRVGDWRVCEPFGFGDSWRLRGEIERRAEDGNPGLKRLLASYEAERLERYGGSLEEHRAVLRARAEERIAARLGEETHESPIYRYLERMAICAAEIEVDCEEGRSPPSSSIEGVMREGAKAMEGLFKWLSRQYAGRFGSCCSNLAEKRGDPQSQKIVRESAKRIGFQPVPFEVTNIDRYAAEKAAAADEKTSSARPFLTAHVLAAARDPSHPFWGAAAREPKLLQWLDDLTTWRNISSHDASHKLTEKNAEDAEETVYLALEILGAPPAPTRGRARGARRG